MTLDPEALKRTPAAVLEKETHHDLLVRVQNLETQRLLWTRRVALYERRADGLEELLAQMIQVLNTVFTKQREELSRIAGIAANCAMFADRKSEELEAMCNVGSDDESEPDGNG